MPFINTTTKAYPVSEADIRALHPNTSFPAAFSAPAPFAWVFPSPQPAHDAYTQTAKEGAPVKSAQGNWEQVWTVENLPADAVAQTLATMKAAKNDEINAARLAANRSTFTHGGKQFACDELSRSDIDGTNGFVALYGVMPPGWVGGWKAVDNSFYPIATVDDWKAFYTGMFAAGSANFAKAQTLKGQIAAATTPAQVAAIHWEA